MAFLKDEEKKLLLERYKDIEWPDDVADLRCVRCQRVVINHHLSNCQHLFCNNCRRVFSDGGQWKCPQCHEYVTQLDDQDFDVESKIHKLRIFCPNKKYGCKYEDQLSNIPKHLMTCVDTREAALPAEYTGTNRIKAVDKRPMKFSEAIRQLKGISLFVFVFLFSCFCFNFILSNETKFFTFQVKCSKFSEQVTQFDDVNSKLNVLTDRVNSMEKKSEELELASAKSTEELRSIKSLLETVNQRCHQIELHHQQTMEQMALNMQEMRTKMASMTEFKRSEDLNSLKAETYEWTIKDVAKTILKDQWSLESEAFMFTGYKYEIRAKIAKYEEIVSIRLQFKEGDTINKFLNKNGFTFVKFIVKDQRDILIKPHRICECLLLFSDCFGQFDWIFGSRIPAAMLSPPYVKNDCIKIEISLEPASIDHSFVSNNGVLKWRVDNYEARKQEQLYRNIWSPSFYTSPQGYRVKTKLVINYKGSISVEVFFLTGEHDDSLSINFHHKTTVTLFNQLDPSKNLVKSQQRNDVLLYIIQIESITFIEENGFVKDDSLIFSIVIEPVISKWFTK